MTSEPGGKPPGGPGARRRRPPTIDLEATEVASRPAAEPQSASPPPPEPPPETSFTPPPRDPPPDWLRDPPRRQPDPPPDPPDPPPGPRGFGSERFRFISGIAWLPPGLPWPLIGAGAAGAGSVLLAFLLFWLVTPRADDPAVALAPRFATLETQLRELAARPAPASVEPKAIDELGARLGRVEAAVAAPRAPATDPVVLARIGATENAIKSLADNIAALSRRGDDVPAALRDTQSRLDGLAAAVAELRKGAAQATAVGSDRAVRLAVAASALRAAVERGDPFATELAIVKPLAADARPLAPLEPFAVSGVPNNAALARELATLIQPMLRVERGESSRGDGFLNRLQANAEKLVRIRPVDEAVGDSSMAALARVEQRAAHDDVPGALAELGKLPPEVRAPAQAWMTKVAARDKALEAARGFAADAVAALKNAP